MADEVTLFIGTSDSRCGACRRNADPREVTHDMVTMRGEGCGARYTHVANVYSDQADRVRAMRPDLIFAGTELPPPRPTAESIARAFHESYERLAPSFSYKTREASAVPWAHVPENNKRLMVAVVEDLRSMGFL